MKYTDIRGLELTTTSAKAVDYFNKSIAANAEYRESAVVYMENAIAEDPNFCMAQCVLGYYAMGVEALAPEGLARSYLEAAQACDLHKVTERERSSVEALKAWIERRQDDAILIWEKILDHHPLDLLTMQLLHYRNFWLGKEEGIRDSISRHFSHWDSSMPNYSNVLGMYCFGLNENGNSERALEYGRKAIDLNKDDLWAVHAVVHVLNDSGEQSAGLSFLEQFDKSWDDRTALREHLWWHEALFIWELGEYDRALQYFDDFVAKNITPFYLDVQNSASMLWRLESVGVDVGDRWTTISDAALKRIEYRYLPWTDVHVAMTLARTGQRNELDGFLLTLEQDKNLARNARMHAVAETNLAVCKAISFYCNGDYSNALEQLLAVRSDNFRPLGASNAQRDVIGMIGGLAALKAKEFEAARSIFSQRLEAKPQNQMTWLFLAQAAQGCGDEEGAARARAKASTILN